MGKLRKIGKKIGRAIKKVGQKFKRAFGKVAKAFGKLGPIGTIAMSVLLPGLGTAMSGWLGSFGSGVMKLLPKGASTFLSGVGEVVRNVAINPIKNGISKVYGSVTDVLSAGFDGAKNFIEQGVNKLGGVVGKDELGTDIRTFIKELKAPKATKGPKVTDATNLVTEMSAEEKAEALGLTEKYADEMSAYKKVTALKEFGEGIQAQEDEQKAIAEYEANRKRAAYSAEGLQTLYRPMGIETLTGQATNFVDNNVFQNATSVNEMAKAYSENILNVPLPPQMKPLEFINKFVPYGMSFQDVLGLSD